MPAFPGRLALLAFLTLGLAMPSHADEPSGKPEEKGPISTKTKQLERAVAASLNWLARHQNADGSWSLNHTPRCAEERCSGAGDASSDSAATAMALLPFLAAGQTHESKGPYKAAIGKGLNWLLTHQKQTGDLSAGGTQMYSHGLATIALCESYGMTKDARVGFGAQAALNFIMSGQNAAGGWRYTHGSADSDMSVVGWQASALKSGQLSGLKVNAQVFDGLRKYVDSSAQGDSKDRFGYTPKSPPSLTMTATGLLVSQYLGEKSDSPAMVAGMKAIEANLPAMNRRNCYYWYTATRLMHHAPAANWDKWSDAMRPVLIESQDKERCAAGSWNPEKPTGDAWGKQGGRLMITSLSCLTLEVAYNKYLSLHRHDLSPPKPAGEKEEKKE